MGFESANILNIGFLLICAMLEIPTVMSHHTNNLVYAPVVVDAFPAWLCTGGLYMYSIFVLPYASINLSVSQAFYEKGALLYPINLQSYCNDVAYWVSGTAVERYSPSFKSHTKRVMLAGGEENVKLPLVVHVGRIAVEKDSHDIPACFNDIAKAMKRKVRFAIVGGGFALDEIRQEIEKGDAAGLVTYPGWQSGHDLSEIYASADCFFAPTRDEAFGLVYLEAMNSGLPCVGPRQGGAKDRIVEGVHGNLYEPGNGHDAALKIMDVLANKERMAIDCRAYAEKFTWERSISDLLEFYSGVIKEVHRREDENQLRTQQIFEETKWAGRFTTTKKRTLINPETGAALGHGRGKSPPLSVVSTSPTVSHRSTSSTSDTGGDCTKRS